MCVCAFLRVLMGAGSRGVWDVKIKIHEWLVLVTFAVVVGVGVG